MFFFVNLKILYMYNIKYNKKENLNDWYVMIKVYLLYLVFYVKWKGN